jgi:hypothetical protein
MARFVRKATHDVPLERLALSPQCGFVSAEAGNPLTLEEQEAELRPGGQIAWQVGRTERQRRTPPAQCVGWDIISPGT